LNRFKREGDRFIFMKEWDLAPKLILFPGNFMYFLRLYLAQLSTQVRLPDFYHGNSRGSFYRK
jgi:hypothetical protein